MDDSRTLFLARLIAGIGLLVGGYYLVGDLRAPAPTHDPVAFGAPTDIGPHTLGIAQRLTTEGVFVDVQYGPHTVPGAAPVRPNPVRGGVYERYGARFALYRPRAAADPWKLLEVDADSDPPRVRLIELPADPPVATTIETPTLEAMRTEIDRITRGAPPRRVPLLPGPSWLLLGAAVWLCAGLRRRPACAPTVALTLVLAAVGAVVAWPLVLHLGRGPAVPAAFLGLITTLVIAAATGPKLQAIAFARGRAGSALAGAIVGALLLGVYVMAAVNINGFIAPVFRPPGNGLSPADWFRNDVVVPAAALLGTGLLPALVGGALYGLLGRPRGRTG